MELFDNSICVQFYSAFSVDSLFLGRLGHFLGPRLGRHHLLLPQATGKFFMDKFVSVPESVAQKLILTFSLHFIHIVLQNYPEG